MKTTFRTTALTGTLALSLMGVGCATEKPAQTPETSASKAEAAPAAASTEKGLRLYVFECGDIDVADDAIFHANLNTPGVKRHLIGSCYLIVHPKGTLAWDTGLPDELVTKPEGIPAMKVFTLRVKKTLASQYQAIGVAPDSVNYLGISHMHQDHRGNVGLFPRSTLLVQKEEYESVLGPDSLKFGNDPAQYPTLKSNPVKKLEGDLDVFGDGSVVIKRALGHTPGHQALFVKLPKTGNILLSGDLVHFTDNWKARGVPAWNFDKERSVKTMQETEQFLQANHATLWIQHDYEQSATLRHAPGFYE
ncbi:N-acyl homoserine lactonase family protein [Pendulispora brunnea]|uniref:N-acyl homoserine lactonase family protein n=1 Tax=Pendulispora brunnea TaxID=2905690 RepID=A0ABZ2K7P7_9BACT